MSQNMDRVVRAAKLLREARELFARVSGAAASEEQAEGVAKANGAHPLVKIAKARAEAAKREKHRLTRLRIEEVSLCDAPASQGCFVVLKKGAGHPLVQLARARREAGR